MAIRPFVTAGVAFAAAGVMALTPAIVPQLTEQEKAVAAMTQADLKLAANLQDLINVFFGVDPAPNDDNIPPVTDAPGTSGVSGLIYQLLSEQQGGFTPNRQLLDQFFQVGLTEVVRQQMLAYNPSNAQTINDFFDGGLTQLAYRYASSGATTELQQVYLDYYFNQYSPNPALSGVSGVTYVWLMNSQLSPEQKSVVNDFYTGGATQVVWNQLLARTSDPVQTQFINDFFTGGVTQNARTFLLGATQDPQQQRDIALFFPDAYTGYEGGITENIQDRFVNATSDPQQQAVINAYFDEGAAEVIRLLLVGPKPVAEEEGEGFAARAFSAPEASAAGGEVAEPAATPEGEAAPAGDVVQVSAPAASAADTGSPAAVPAAAPAAPPATAPAADLTPNQLAKAERAAGETEDATASIKDGNKAEVTPILPFGSSTKSGEGSWGVFGQVADAIGKTIAGAAGGTPSGGEGGDSGGSSS